MMVIKTTRKHKAVRRFNKLVKKVKSTYVSKLHKFPRGIDLAIRYGGGLDRDRDREIYKVLGEYSTGSGFSFVDGKRDVTATVPVDKLPRVVRTLKKIPEIEIKKCVVEWVVV